MVLQGLQHSLLLAWLFGVLPLKSPTGTPEQLKKKHPFSVFRFSLFFLNLLFRMDFYLAHNFNLSGESMVAKFLDLGFLVGESCFDWFFRFSLAFRSKLLVRFLKALESDMKKFALTLQLSGEDRKDWKVSSRIVWATLLLHFISGALVTYWVWSSITHSGSRGSVLLKFLPEWLYIIFYYVFGELPVICSISLAFSLVIVTIFHLFWIFYDFCECLEEQIAIYNGKVDNGEKLAFAKHHLGELDNYSVYSVAATAMQIQKQEQNLRKEPLSTDKLVGKLEHLKLVCSQFDKVCGPLLLGLIVRAVYVLISSANSILLYNNPDGSPEKRVKNMLDLFLFPTELAQLWLLPLGAAFKKKINARKEKLARMVIFMTNLEAKTDMRNVITSYTEWNWTLTGGPGFFDIDRSLLSGVVSSLMTYVTIIFQLNTDADEGASPDHIGEAGPLQNISHSLLNSSRIT